MSGTAEAKQAAEGLAAAAPWYVSGTRTRHNAMPVLQIISEPSGEVLALVPYSDRTPKAHAECYADARLIAAAPELLDALKAVRAHMPDYPDTIWQNVDEVIARAEGRQP